MIYENNDIKYITRLYRYIICFLLLLIFILSFSLLTVLKKEQLIVGIDSNRNPIPFVIVSEIN